MSQVADLTRFAEALKLVKGKKVKLIAFRAIREAIMPVQRVASAQYGQAHGLHDQGQSEAKIAWRWGGKSRHTLHPIGESRRNLAISIARKVPKLKMIRGGQAFLGKMWGQTQNSFLLEFGRTRDALTRYRGWGLMTRVVATMSAHAQNVLAENIKKEIEKLNNQFWREFARPIKGMKK